ncbi:unnamed protein product [Prunus armeniaca]
MGLQWLPSLQVLFTFLLFLILVLKIGRDAKPITLLQIYPPRPWKLPFIGNIQQLIGSLPHHGLRDLAKRCGPLMHLRLGEVSTVVVSLPEFAKEYYRRIREDEVVNLIKWVSLRARSPINLTEELYSSTYSIASHAAFGKTTKDHEGFIYVVKKAMNVAGGFDLADVFPSAHLLHLISEMRPKHPPSKLGNVRNDN